MKKIYILIIALFTLTTVNCQIPILTSYNTVPIAGDTFTIAILQNDTINPGQSGSNIYWDYSNLNYSLPLLQYYASLYITGSMTPSTFYYSTFPDANLFIKRMSPTSNDNTFTNEYYKSDSISFNCLGFIAHNFINDIGSRFPNSELVMKFPFTFMSTATDSTFRTVSNIIYYPNIFEIYEYNTKKSIIADGWGNINISGVLHTNVLRIKILDSVTTTRYLWSSLPNFPDSFRNVTKSINCSYLWYDGFNRQFLMGIYGKQDSSSIFHSSYLKITNVGIPSLSFSTFNNIPQNNIYQLSLYPNPATNTLTLTLSQLQQLQNATVSIYDIQGEQLLHQNITEMQTQINISSFAKGIYIVKLQTDKETLQSKFVKE